MKLIAGTLVSMSSRVRGWSRPGCTASCATPLAADSRWGSLVLVPAWGAGYSDYTRRVRYRLVPGV